MTRILIVDDEPINHQLVARALESLDLQLEFASNGNEGIAQAHTFKPDAIITDVMMPGRGGWPERGADAGQALGDLAIVTGPNKASVLSSGDH